jgi:hypothetical protein
VAIEWRRTRVLCSGIGCISRCWVGPGDPSTLRHGCHADLDGGYFDYPVEAFDLGVLAVTPMPCLSRKRQLRFHRGYEPRAVDLHDLQLLEQPGNRHCQWPDLLAKPGGHVLRSAFGIWRRATEAAERSLSAYEAQPCPLAVSRSWSDDGRQTTPTTSRDERIVGDWVARVLSE